MRVAAVFVATLMLAAGAHRQACATNYCPEGFYGYMNGYYMYYVHYCTPSGGCASTGVAVSSMYSCGGDFECCLPMASCIDPIPGGDVHAPIAASNAPAAKKPAAAAKQPAPTKKVAAPATPTIPMRIGEMPQKNYLSASEKFILPGDHVTKSDDILVKIPEPDGGVSYFRLFSLTYVGVKPENQGTVFMGMEMDPENPPAKTQTGATRKKKGAGDVYKHTVAYQGQDYDVCSVRVLPDTP
jgi:hypothetical protein